jgi:hypothetical protein
MISRIRFNADATPPERRIAMSQIVAVKNGHGIVLAADGIAVDFDPGGEMLELKVGRLIELTPRTAVLTGGAAEGEKMCRNLKDFVQEEGLEGIDEVYGAALPFLATEYERFMRKHCETLPLDPIHHVHFILAGHTEKDPSNPYQLHLIWTKKKLPQLDGEEIASAFAIPRQLRLEYKLNRFHKEDAPLDQMISEISESLERLGETQEEIGGPFSYATITSRGFERVG